MYNKYLYRSRISEAKFREIIKLFSVDLGYKKHYRLDHGKDEFVRGKSHINGIEGFWGYAKTRLSKFKGMHKTTFYLHLKETEYRYNYRNENLYNLVIENLRKNPLKLS